LESSINADAGGGTLAGRETFVGLQGSWGTLKIGNFLAPYDDIHPIFGNVPTLDDVDPGHGECLGKQRWLHKDHRCVRRPPRQFGSLRLAEHRGLHG
jgi:predicted porin